MDSTRRKVLGDMLGVGVLATTAAGAASAAQVTGTGSIFPAGNVAEARALTSSAAGSVVFGAGPDGGLFIHDPSDTSSADDGGRYFGSVFVDKEGRRFKRPSITSYDPAWYGPVGTEDDSAAVQAALNAGKHLSFQIGRTYSIKGIMIDGNDLSIHVPPGAFLQNARGSSAPMFIIGRQADVERMRFYAHSIAVHKGGGHVFDVVGTINHSTIEVDHVVQEETSKSIINLTDGKFYFNRIRGSQWTITTAHKVAAIEMSSTSNKISANDFEILRPDRSGSQPFMRLNSTSTSDYNYGNRIHLSNPEACNGGVLQISRAFNTEIGKMHCFDVGDIVNDMIEVGIGDHACRNTIIAQYMRNSGSLGTGKADIKLTAATGTIITQPSGPNRDRKVLIDANHQSDVSIQYGGFFSVVNMAGGGSSILDYNGGVANAHS